MIPLIVYVAGAVIAAMLLDRAPQNFEQADNYLAALIRLAAWPVFLAAIVALFALACIAEAGTAAGKLARYIADGIASALCAVVGFWIR